MRSTFRSSELSRSSAEVFEAAESHPVTVTRRDGESLVLMSENENNERDELLQLAAQLIGAATIEGGSLSGYMTQNFPWMLALSPDDREECAHEVLDAARASFSAGQSHLAIATLTSWRETASALAAGLGKEQVAWLENDEPVARP